MYYDDLLKEDLWGFLAYVQRNEMNWGRLKNEWWKFHQKEFKFWNGKFDEPVNHTYKISICIPCMNRLEEVKVAISKNIESNADYEKFEIVLLDYNSSDGLENWVKSEMMDYIKSGLLVYYRTEEPEYWCPQHSRNVVMKLGSGDIINMVDANKFTTEGFATYINAVANQIDRPAIFAKAMGKRSSKSYFRLFGRIGFFYDDFIKLGGYNEQLSGYGWQDRDLLYRAMAVGFSLGWYEKYLWRLKSNHGSTYFHSRNEELLFTHDINCLISYSNLFAGKFIANEGNHWGKAKLIKNFKEELEI